MSNHFFCCLVSCLFVDDVNNFAIEASYWIEPDIADYEWTRDWGVMIFLIEKQKQALKHRHNNKIEGVTQDMQDQESNEILGNRIQSRFKRNLVENEELEIVVNPKTVSTLNGFC